MGLSGCTISENYPLCVQNISYTDINWDSFMIYWSDPALGLTHLPLDKMAAISQTTFSNAFLWMKKFEFWLKFHCSLFLRVQLTMTLSIGLDNDLVPNRASKTSGTSCIVYTDGFIQNCGMSRYVWNSHPTNPDHVFEIVSQDQIKNGPGW